MGYGNHTFTKAEWNYSTPKRELYAMYLACKQWRYHILGRTVTIHTDHKSLKDLNLKEPNGILARWLETIWELNLKVNWIPRSKNIVANALTHLIPKVVYMILLNDKEDQLNCIKEVHSGSIGGHFQLTKTYDLIRDKYYWPGMKKDIQNYINQCEYCQHYKPKNSNALRTTMTPLVSNKAWEIVGLDIVPFTLRNNEKKNALVMVDYFSKEIIAASLNSTKAEEIISKVEQELIWPKRCPSKIVSDRGPQLMSGEVRQWMESRAIEHSPTTAYHQQANGQVERMIQSLKQVVQNKLTQRMKWKEALKAACSSMNNFLRNSTTKYTLTKSYMVRNTTVPMTMISKQRGT